MLVAASLVLGLTACASAGRQRAPALTVAVPADWAATQGSATTPVTALAKWWLRFDDALLASLVSQALQTNTSVRSAEAALRQSRALRDVSAAGLLPTIGSSASAQREISAGKVTGNTFRAGLDANWELDIFGANRSALDASEATRAASAASLGDVQVSIAAEVALGYISLRGAQLRLAIAADNLASQLETLRQRPDVRAAEFQVTAALARVSQAEAARMPNFQLGGSLGLVGLTLGALNSASASIGALLASVSMPVFDGGARRAQVRAQQAALDQAAAAYQSAVLAALADVEDALVALRGDREILLSLQRAAEAAGNAAQLARLRYDSGLIDFQSVLDTGRSVLNAQDNLAIARSDLSADHVRLYKALGGGWQPDQSEPPAPATEAATRTDPQ